MMHGLLCAIKNDSSPIGPRWSSRRRASIRREICLQQCSNWMHCT